MRRNIGPFGVKDLFTLVNLMGGVFAIVFAIRGQPARPPAPRCWLGYLLGDTLDGPVARMTKTSNQFGSELDTATDHFVQAHRARRDRLRRVRAGAATPRRGSR